MCWWFQFSLPYVKLEECAELCFINYSGKSDLSNGPFELLWFEVIWMFRTQH